MEEKPRLSDRIRRTARLKHLSLRTENSYLNWIKRYYFFCNKQDPAQLGKEEIRNFLSHLAADQYVSASTQNQAFREAHVDLKKPSPLWIAASPFANFLLTLGALRDSLRLRLRGYPRHWLRQSRARLICVPLDLL